MATKVDVLRLIALYRKLNLLSIDVALGAVVCSALLAKVFKSQTSLRDLAILGISVWSIYTLDHLIDGLHTHEQSLSARHFFHRKYTVPLSISFAVAVIINAVLVMGLDNRVLVAGVAVGGLVLLYFLVQSRIRGFKEFLCGLIYLAGVLICPVTQVRYSLNPYAALITVQLFLVIEFNLLMFSWFDQRVDRANGWSSFSTRFGGETTRMVLIGLAILQLITFVVSVSWNGFQMISVVLLLMNAILILIFFQPQYFSILDRYRLLGDAVFLLPVFSIAFS